MNTEQFIIGIYKTTFLSRPGAYNTDANRKKIPAITIRGRTRSSSSAHDAPSPASYYPNYHYLHKGPSPMMTSRPTLKPHQIFRYILIDVPACLELPAAYTSMLIACVVQDIFTCSSAPVCL